ncbi:MAG: hypothetical protein NTNFB02_24090 [Nitrospira sp.]
MRRYWIGSSASSLCTFLPTDMPFGRLRSGLPFRLRGDGFPEFTRCFNHSFLWKLHRYSRLLYQLSYRGTVFSSSERILAQMVRMKSRVFYAETIQEGYGQAN